MDVQNDFKSKEFAYHSGKIHYLQHEGDGPKLLFVHGFASSWRTWTRLVHRLPENFNIVLMDLLGHGDSDSPDLDYSLKTHYDSVKALIDELKMQDCFIVGHSYGGWIGSYYAALNKNLRGLILESPTGLGEIYAEREFTSPEFKEWIIKKGLELNPSENVLRKMLYADNKDEILSAQMLGLIEARTLIIWGAGDTTINPKYANVFKNYIKGSELEILEGERHTPHYTDPGPVAELIRNFVEKG